MNEPLPNPDTPLLRLAGSQWVRGYAHGLRQPCLRVRLLLSGTAADAAGWQDKVRQAFADQLVTMPDGPVAAPADALQGLLEPLNALVVRVYETAGWTVADGLRCVFVNRAGPEQAVVGALIAVPGPSEAAALAVTRWACSQLSALAAGGDLSAHGLADVLEQVTRQIPQGENARLLSGAAHRQGVPMMTLPGGTVLYGWGSRSRWMLSTFTDRTPAISVMLARDKLASNALLRAAGLPVPRQLPVSSWDETVAAADRLGYPVVVKPVDLDGGVGVSAGLDNPVALRRAFDKAQRLGRRLLVEKHIVGNDYRLGVVHGKLAWATWREPGGVRGDGVSTVTQLLEQVNSDARRSNHRWSNMRPLLLDDDALEMLGHQQLAPNGVPEAGRFVQLRRTANIASGGTPTRMLGRVHPDNVALALRATRALRLDIAGIDFITPDITRSWLEVGGAICEINAQPQFSVVGPEAPVDAIAGLFDGDGRIPVAVVLTRGDGSGAWPGVAAALAERGWRLGLSTAGGLSVGSEVLRNGRRSAFDDARTLLMNPETDAVLVVTDGAEWVRSGLPFDRADLLVEAADADGAVASAIGLTDAAERWRLDGTHDAADPALVARLADGLAARAEAAHQRPRPGP